MKVKVLQVGFLFREVKDDGNVKICKYESSLLFQLFPTIIQLSNLSPLIQIEGNVFVFYFSKERLSGLGGKFCICMAQNISPKKKRLAYVIKKNRFKHTPLPTHPKQTSRAPMK